jgi:hypothetical protein
MADTATEPMDTQGAGVAPEASDWGKMTLEERQADVDALVKEAQATEEPGDSKSPAPPDPDQSETNETPGDGDETPADADAVEEDESRESDKSPDEDEVEEEPGPDWRDGETRDFASTMGLTDEDLESLSSREELDRVLRIIDRQAFKAGQAALDNADAADPPKNPPPPPPPKQEPEKPPSDDVFGDLADFKLGDQFDEDAAKPVNSFVERTAGFAKDTAAELRALRAEVANLVQQRQAEAVESIRRQAMESLHTLGHTDLFGEPGKPPTMENMVNINKAIDAHMIHAAGLLSMGRQSAPTPEFLKAAVRREFGDQIAKNEQRQRTRKLKKQSAKITGGLSSKTIADRKPGQSTLEAVNSDPEIDKLFNDLVSGQSG